MITVIVLETNTTRTTIEIDMKINTKGKTKIEMTAMTELEVGLKNRDTRENIEIIIKTHMTKITIELVTRIGTKIDTKIKTNTEIDSYDLGRGRSRDRPHTYDGRKVTNRSKL